MTKKLKTIIGVLFYAAAIFFLYKFICVRTVYYEIGGIKIPSKYNVVTGTVKPISNYKGKTSISTVEARKTNKMGLTDEEVTIAKIRWAIFEQWANSRPEFRGWQKDAALFKKAHEAFKRQLDAYGKSLK